MGKTTKRGAANLDSTRVFRKSHAKGAVSLRFVVCVSALVLMLTGSLTSAQQGSTAAKSERKLVTRVEPEYPAILRARQIGGEGIVIEEKFAHLREELLGVGHFASDVFR